MSDFFERLFDYAGFTPRYQCGGWSDELALLHSISDLAIFGAYLALPILIAYFCWKWKTIPFRRTFIVGALFILFCGLTHLFSWITGYWPIYRASGMIKVSCALISWIAVVDLKYVLPQILAGRQKEKQKLTEFDQVLEHAVEGIARLDDSGYFLEVNESFTTTMGHNDLVGRHWLDVFLAADIAMASQAYKTMLERGRAEFELRGVKADGSVYYQQSVLVPIYNLEDGTFAGNYYFTRDITRRKLEEKASSERISSLEDINRQLKEDVTELIKKSRSAEKVDLEANLNGVMSSVEVSIRKLTSLIDSEARHENDERSVDRR